MFGGGFAEGHGNSANEFEGSAGAVVPFEKIFEGEEGLADRNHSS